MARQWSIDLAGPDREPMPKQPPLYSSFPQPYPPSSGSRHAIAALAELRTNHSYLQLMISNPGTSLPVMYSTPRAEAVARYVAARYAMAGPLECSLLHRGFNDSFEVRYDGGQHAVLRLSSKRARGDADVASETHSSPIWTGRASRLRRRCQQEMARCLGWRSYRKVRVPRCFSAMPKGARLSGSQPPTRERTV